MNKTLLFGGLLAANIFGTSAQESNFAYANEALNISREDAVSGNARYSAMAGAMAAFGGNTSAVKDNPAGLGVYRKWDISFTPSIGINNDGEVDCKMNNFGVIMNFGKSGRTNGYVTSSLGITYNRLRNYSRYDYTYGTLMPSRPDSTEQYYDNEYSEDHGAGEWDFAYGVNISNKVFIGAGINVMNVDYSMTSEFLSTVDNTYTGVDVSATGWNMKVGLIYKPVDQFRVSLAFHSPTWLRETRDVYTDDDEPWTEEFDVTTPLKLDAGVGFVIANKALIGIDYTMQNFASMRTEDKSGHLYRQVQNEIEDQFKQQHTLKIGAEVQLGSGFAARAGYAFQSAVTNDLSARYIRQRVDDPNDGGELYSYALPKLTQYLSLGLGYQGKVFYCDLAYLQKRQNEDFYEWIGTNTDDELTEPIDQTSKFHNVVMTFGFRF